MPERNEKGQFTPGNKASPGRPKRSTEAEYLDVTFGAVSLSAWRDIITKAVSQAKRGDAKARDFLAGYILGKPAQIVELDATLRDDRASKMTDNELANIASRGSARTPQQTPGTPDAD